MRVFRATYRDRKGKRQESAKWYVEFLDHTERIRRVPGFTDKRQAEELGRRIEKLVVYQINGDEPDRALSAWLESLPRRVKENLSVIGLLSTARMTATKPLADHLADFHRGLLAKGGTAEHADLTQRRIQSVFDGCGFRYWSAVQATKVEQYLADRRDKTEKGQRRLSRQSSNYYLQAFRQFARWMVKNNRAITSPVEHLAPLNAAVDRRSGRRALTVDELRRLLGAARSGADTFGISGIERAMLYTLAAESGLRSNELRSLDRASFRFGNKIATVTVEAVNSKR